MTFSHAVLVAVLDVANWSGRISGNLMSINAVTVVAGEIRIAYVPGAVDPGPDVVTFAPPPFDVVSDTFKPTPAPAFANYPIT